MAVTARPTLAVWKFTSCDGCQLTLLDCEDELLAVAGAVRIAHFTEATRAELPGPWDVSLVEGSISTREEEKRIRHVRANSGTLVTIGACATAGGIQALRNLAGAGGLEQYRRIVYARPEHLPEPTTVRAIADVVPVDLELHGCPISKAQLLETLAALLAGRRPDLPGYSVCVECKARGTTCLPVSRGVACLGPVTRAGCGALCPAYGRGCFGCFGPADGPNLPALTDLLRARDMDDGDVERVFTTFTAPAWEKERT